MKNKKRALRRHHESRVYNKRRKLFRQTHFWYGDNDKDHWLDKWHWMKDTGKLCSCYVCGGLNWSDDRHKHKINEREEINDGIYEWYWHDSTYRSANVGSSHTSRRVSKVRND